VKTPVSVFVLFWLDSILIEYIFFDSQFLILKYPIRNENIERDKRENLIIIPKFNLKINDLNKEKEKKSNGK